MTHRKFHRFARSVGSVAVARGILELLWDGCYESGDDYLGTAADIDQRIGWSGEPGTVALALVACGLPEGHGFIEPAQMENGGPVTYRVHDLWHHAPDYVQKRHQREMGRRQKTGEPNGAERRQTARSPVWLPGVDRTPAPARAPAPAPAHTSSAEPDGSTPDDASPTFLEFPVVGTDGPVWCLTEAALNEWATLFPVLDVRQEARNALAWVLANPGRRKTGSGMRKFLVGWFTRQVNQGGGQSRRVESKPARAAIGPNTYAGPCPGGHTPRCANAKACGEKMRAERVAS